MITKKDLDIIRQCLLQSGVRNSDFKTAKELKGDEYIAFIDKGQNHKIKVKDMGFAKSLVIQGHEYPVDNEGNINVALSDIAPESCLTIRYKGESPIGISWNTGDLFYNTRTNKLFQSTAMGFKQVSLISGKIYYVQSNSSFYYYNSKISSTLIPFLLSGINIKTINGQPITGNGNLQISGEGTGTGTSCITIYLKGDSYRGRNINEGDDLWQIGDLWYDTDNEQLMQCISKNPDTFEPVGFIDGSIYYVAGPPEEVEFFYYNSTVSEQPIHISNLTVDDVKVIAKPVIKKYTDNILPYDGIITVQPEDYMSNYMQGHSGSMQIFYNSVDGHFIARSDSHPDLYYNNWTRTDSVTRVTRTYEDYENVSFVYRIHNGNLFIYKVTPTGLVGINGLEGFKEIYNVSYITDMQDNIPTGDAEHMYALDPDIGILYQWNESTGDWDAADRGDDPYSIIIYKGRIGYLYPDDFEWMAFISVPESYKIMEISGFLPSSTIIYREQDTYTGEEGEVILDLRSNMALLKVTNGTSTYYYSNWTAAGSHFSSDMYDISNTIFAYIESGRLHMGVVKNHAFVEISGQNNITIDSALSATSSNPVRNSTIYNEVSQINGALNSFSERMSSIEAACIMPIDGIINTASYNIVQQDAPYAGENGRILIDTIRGRIILYVENDDPTATFAKGYLSWNEAGGRKPSSEYNLETQFFWFIGPDGLHIGRYEDHQFIEITGAASTTIDTTISSTSDNPVKNSTIYYALGQKQDKLVSGVNIARVNGNNLLAGGNIVISTADSVILKIDEIDDNEDPVISALPPTISGGQFVYSTALNKVLYKLRASQQVTDVYYEQWTLSGYPSSLQYSKADLLYLASDPYCIYRVTDEGLELLGNLDATPCIEVAFAGSNYLHRSTFWRNGDLYYCTSGPDKDKLYEYQNGQFEEKQLAEGYFYDILEEENDVMNYYTPSPAKFPLYGSFSDMLGVDPYTVQTGMTYLVTDTGSTKPYWAIKTFSQLNGVNIPIIRWVDAQGNDANQSSEVDPGTQDPGEVQPMG